MLKLKNLFGGQEPISVQREAPFEVNTNLPYEGPYSGSRVPREFTGIENKPFDTTMEMSSAPANYNVALNAPTDAPAISQGKGYDEGLAALLGKIQNPNSETAPPRKGDKMDRTLSGMALGHEPFQMKTRGIEKYWEDKPIYGQPDTPATGEESRRVEEKIRRLEQPIGEKNLENIRAGG